MTTADKLASALGDFVRDGEFRRRVAPAEPRFHTPGWHLRMARAWKALKEHEEQNTMNEGLRQDIADSLGVTADRAYALYYQWKNEETTLSLIDWYAEYSKATYEVTVERTSTRSVKLQVRAHDRAHAELLALELARDTVFSEAMVAADYEVTQVEKQ